MSAAVAAAAHVPAYLPPVAVLVLAAAVIGYLCVRLRVVPIVGFLLAGVLVGPDALGVVEDREVVDAAGEVGVMLLLFSIGVEFSLSRLAAIRRTVLLGGSVQVVSAVGLTAAVLIALGVGWRPAVFTGFLVALSSTAIVLKLLGDRGETGSETGRTALGLLVFQDLAVVAMVLLVPTLGGGAGGSAGQAVRALLTAVAVVAVVLLLARRVVPRLLEAVARACSPEVFLLAVVALCLGTALLTAAAGVSVSLGAFLAGLVVSESRHSSHALAEVVPLQIVFSAVFFLSVGTLLDVRFLLREPLLVAGAVLLVLLVKVVTTALAARAVGVSAAATGSLALLLAQVGEFAFVLEGSGRAVGLSPFGLGEDGGQAFVAATVLLLVASPALAAAGRGVEQRTARRRRAAAPAAVPAPAAGDGHVLVSGWGPTARAVARELTGAGVPVVVTTLNPDGAAEAEEEGYEVVRGDPTRGHVLQEARLGRARAVLVGDDEPARAEQIAGVVSSTAPGVPVVVRAPDAAAVEALHEAGAARVVLADRAAALHVARAVLDSVRPPGPQARTVVDTSLVVAFRADPAAACAHAALARPVVPSRPGCEECLRTGAEWVHLRLCAQCGHVGCCDSSPGRHARAHAEGEQHPLMRSAEPGERWGWCFLDERELPPAAPAVRGGVAEGAR